MSMAKLTNNPSVSIIIVNYNGINFVESCLKSVFATNYDNFEVILIDNASNDASLKLIKEKYYGNKNLEIIENKKNFGPTSARNTGIGIARGKYLAFLDNDTEVDKDWLKELVSAFETDSGIGAAQSKLLLSDKKTIDTCGHYLSIIGFPYEIGQNDKNIHQNNCLTNILGARSAAMFVKKSVLHTSGVFDKDYFIYSEDTDLSWRVWLANHRVVYVPKSIVYHKKGGSLNAKSCHLIFYEGAKNCTKTLIKNLGLKNLLIILPLHLSAWIILSFLFILKGKFIDAKAVINGLCWDIANIRHIFRDRKNTQNMRLASDKKIMPIIMGSYGMGTLFKKGIAWIGGS